MVPVSRSRRCDETQARRLAFGRSATGSSAPLTCMPKIPCPTSQPRAPILYTAGHGFQEPCRRNSCAIGFGHKSIVMASCGAYCQACLEKPAAGTPFDRVNDGMRADLNAVPAPCHVSDGTAGRDVFSAITTIAPRSLPVSALGGWQFSIDDGTGRAVTPEELQDASRLVGDRAVSLRVDWTADQFAGFAGFGE